MPQNVATRFDVFNGTDGSIQIQVNELSRTTGLESALDTSGVDRAQLSVLSSPVVSVDSDSAPAKLSWNDTGLFTAVLGGESIAEGTYSFRLIVRDEASDDTQLIHEDMQETTVRVLDTTAIA
jgi:hypothetical protein